MRRTALLATALRGRFTSHRTFLLTQLLPQLDHSTLIGACEAQIALVTQPVAAHIQRPQAIVGVGPRSA